MQALILAAGQGQRMRPLTNDIPKCLVLYCGRPILEYCLENIDLPTIIVGGYKAEKLLKYGKVLVNENYANSGMVESLFCASPEDDILISYSDIIYNKVPINLLKSSCDDIAIIADDNYLELWQKRMPNPLKDLETFRVRDEYLIEIGNKPTNYSEIESQYTGLLKINLGVWNPLKNLYYKQNNPNLHMTHLLSLAIKEGFKVRVIRVNKCWMEFDTPSDLLITNYLF